MHSSSRITVQINAAIIPFSRATTVAARAWVLIVAVIKLICFANVACFRRMVSGLILTYSAQAVVRAHMYVLHLALARAMHVTHTHKPS